DAEVDMTVRRQAGIGFGKRCLRLDRTLNGIDGAAELCQHAVPGSIGNPTATGGNQTIKDVASLGQILEGTALVAPKEAAVPLDVGRKNRDQPALGIARLCQATPSETTQIDYRTSSRGNTSKFGFGVSFSGNHGAPASGRPQKARCLAGRSALPLRNGHRQPDLLGPGCRNRLMHRRDRTLYSIVQPNSLNLTHA